MTWRVESAQSLRVSRTAWEDFVERAITDEPDDPHVRLLRERIAAGAKVMRVHFTAAPPHGYLVVLERLRELSEQHIPHSRSFTRWSLANGVRMATETEEIGRFGVVLGEDVASIEDEVGAKALAEVALIERLRELSPPTAMREFLQHHYVSAGGMPVSRLVRLRLDRVLRARCVELHAALGYDAEEVARVLDRAVAHCLTQRYRAFRVVRE